MGKVWNRQFPGFNPTLIRLKEYEYIMRAYSEAGFNPTLIRLKVALGRRAMIEVKGFNPTLIRGWPFTPVPSKTKLRVSIPP